MQQRMRNKQMEPRRVNYVSETEDDDFVLQVDADRMNPIMIEGCVW